MEINDQWELKKKGKTVWGGGRFGVATLGRPFLFFFFLSDFFILFLSSTAAISEKRRHAAAPLFAFHLPDVITR